MIIVADDAIPGAGELFARLGELRLLPGRGIGREAVKDADVLLVRSVTRVDAALLRGTSVRVVGSATSGTDHIDAAYLEGEGIRLHTAKGANAEAVADYCFAALAFLKRGRGAAGQQLKKQQSGGRQSADLPLGIDPERVSIGIVGMGCTGSAFYRRLRGLGLSPLVCDPPLQEREPDRHRYSSLEEVMACSIVSLHVPLTHGGIYPTAGLVDRRLLSLIGGGAMGEPSAGVRKGGAALINTSRGEVVNDGDLKAALRGRPGLACVLDVWRGEPGIDRELLGLAALATPHIAGYSRQAKWEASCRLFAALRGEEAGTPVLDSPGFGNKRRGNDGDGGKDEGGAADAADVADVAVEDPWGLPLRYLDLPGLSEALKAGGDFEGLRRSVAERTQFGAIPLPPGLDPGRRRILAGLGFGADLVAIPPVFG